MDNVVTKISQLIEDVFYLGSRDFRGLGWFTRLSEEAAETKTAFETGRMGRSELTSPIILSGRRSIEKPGCCFCV
jgi:hypothetical protein